MLEEVSEVRVGVLRQIKETKAKIVEQLEESKSDGDQSVKETQAKIVEQLKKSRSDGDQLAKETKAKIAEQLKGSKSKIVEQVEENRAAIQSSMLLLSRIFPVEKLKRVDLSEAKDKLPGEISDFLRILKNTENLTKVKKVRAKCKLDMSGSTLLKREAPQLEEGFKQLRKTQCVGLDLIICIMSNLRKDETEKE